MPDLLAAIPAAVVLGLLLWLHGFNRGREDMRGQVVSSLRFSASLRRSKTTDVRMLAWADALDDVADRLERQGQATKGDSA